MKKLKKEHWYNIGALAGLLAANLIFFLAIWLASKYDKVSLDQFIYQMKTSAAGANRSLAKSAVVRVGLYGVLLTAAEVLIFLVCSGYFKNLLHDNKLYIKLTTSRVSRFITRRALPIALTGLVIAISFFSFKLDLPHYVSAIASDSTFIEEHYADPEKVALQFPEQKRNLIYIFLESLEVTFAEPEAGGPITDNFMPELTTLAEENINFSNDDGLGGALSFSGTTWTAAAMVTQTSGMVVQVPLFAQNYGGDDPYIPGLYSIGQVLEKEGYNQTLLVGSDADFADRDDYFIDHGNYNIVDVKSLKEEGRLPQDYREWWGFEDEKLFEYAKEELTKLSEQDAPFNFTMLTCDSHFPNGYVCRLCEEEYDTQYPNVIRCSSKQLAAFIDWCKEQSWYENTTIVICGDHLTMDPNFMQDVSEKYQRTIYNCIINSAVTPVNEKNRLFGTFDMFPTTLAAMGVKIEGERLGIGTNLFADVKTLTEEFGYEEVNAELEKNSEYYNVEFLEMG